MVPSAASVAAIWHSPPSTRSGAEGRVEPVEVGEAVEHRQHAGLRAHRRADRRDRVVEVVGLAAQHDEVVARAGERLGR